ncbi:MAG: SAM hydroxide adenosyltransferase [Gammaproteobacteria bacterium]
MARRLLGRWPATGKRSTFGEVVAGQAYWYENSNGLVEIEVNRRSAAAAPGIACYRHARGVASGLKKPLHTIMP